MKIHYTQYIPENIQTTKRMLSFCGWKKYENTTNLIKNVTCIKCLNKLIIQKEKIILRLSKEVNILKTKLEVK